MVNRSRILAIASAAMFLSAHHCQSTFAADPFSEGASSTLQPSQSTPSPRESSIDAAQHLLSAPDEAFGSYNSEAGFLVRRNISYDALIKDARIWNERNTITNNNLRNNLKANDNQGTITNSGNAVGKYHECTILIEPRNFEDGILEARGRIHSIASDHVAKMKYCKCNCGNKHPPTHNKPKKRSLPDPAPTEALAVPLLLEPTCSVSQGSSGQHYITGSCFKSTLAGRRISSIFPRA